MRTGQDAAKFVGLYDQNPSNMPPVNIAGGTAPAGGPATTTVKGSADLKIKLECFPPGTRTTSQVSGDLFSGAPKVDNIMAYQ
jgi:hypothetical protein